MEVKDIIKENRNKIVPSYEYSDYYREDGSRLYNSNREANWYKIGVHDCFDYFEQNRIKACENEHSQWHKVSDGLPPANKDNPNYSIVVLVTDGEVIREGYCHLPTKTWRWDGLTLIRIRYWMELPELPKEE